MNEGIVFAALLIWQGLEDMRVNYCPTGCLEETHVTPRMSYSTGIVRSRQVFGGGEIYIRRDTGLQHGPFRSAYGVSVTDEGETWVGFGSLWEVPRKVGPFTVEFHSMPGLYFAGDGDDLGGVLEFRSGIEFAYEAKNGIRYGLSIDHRSNADIYRNNPGMETVQFRVSIPTR